MKSFRSCCRINRIHNQIQIPKDDAIMKTIYPRAQRLVITMAVFTFVVATQTRAQTPDQQNSNAQTQTQTAPANDMLGTLNLTPDQIQKIRGINTELRDERQAANLRLRMAQRSLAEAIQSPTPDEALIAQRSKDVADAQANTIR